MASRILSDREVQQLASWPAEVARSDLAAFFMLSIADPRWVRAFRSPRAAADRLGLAVQLCALPLLGFIPADLAGTPVEVVERLADRIRVAPDELARYVQLVSDRSRRKHAQAVISRAGGAPSGPASGARSGTGSRRARASATPQSVLFGQALDHLQAEKIVRPGRDRLMRAVATARTTATREIHQRLQPILIPELCTRLDALVVTDPDLGASRRWCGSAMARPAPSRSPSTPSS